MRCGYPLSMRYEPRLLSGQLPGRRGPLHHSTDGFVLVELLAAMTIMLILASIAIPLARAQVIRSREIELRRDLREMREAIDAYKRFSDVGIFPTKVDSFGYPPDLETLVQGTPWPGNSDLKYKFLRRIPIDPMTGSTDWGLRAMQDDPDARSWGGQNVFDVYTKSDKKALDGTFYANW